MGIDPASLMVEVGLAANAAEGASTLASVGTFASIAGAAIGGIGAVQQGRATAASAKYNAAVASENAAQAQQNATRAGLAGEQQAAMSEAKTRREVGAIQANQAASGINVNTGSAVDVRSSAAENGELDAITIRSNAAREAYGYQTQGASLTAQAGLDKSQAANAAEGGDITGATTFLGGLGQAGLNYEKYQNAGGLSPSSGYTGFPSSAMGLNQ